jgi:dihydroorotate dehydrogenase
LIPLLDLGLPFARLLDAEDAHRLALTALKTLPLPPPPADDPRLKVEAFGLAFSNPVGLAAGFDKDAEVPDAALKIGFGFVEVGTLTPKAQSGNPRPRVFRLPADEAVVNRLGFNNGGFAAAHNRLAKRVLSSGVVGVNVGANRESVDRAADYVEGIKTFAAAADYVTVNISSPNTPGLRDLQFGAALDDLVARVIEARERAAARAGKKPVLLKIAPDLSLNELDGVVAVARKRGIDGIVVANTTIARPRSLRDRAAREEGGLSGRPLFSLSTRMLAETYLRAEGAFPLVGVGGIDSADTAEQKIRAGAALVQLYTALIYKGFSLVVTIKRGLVQRLERERIGKITDLVGAGANAITRTPWPA